jgi:hypothetical protein
VAGQAIQLIYESLSANQTRERVTCGYSLNLLKVPRGTGKSVQEQDYAARLNEVVPHRRRLT